MHQQVQGACLCGAVRFTVSLPTLFCGLCHCSICRRSNGAASVAWFAVPSAQFEITAGQDWVARYASSDHAVREFCASCGSSLFSRSTRHPDQVEIVLASMQGPIDRVPERHVFFDDRASWDTAHDDLPRLGGPSGFEPVQADAA